MPGVEIGATKLVESLKKSSEGYPIEIIESPAFSEIRDLYGRSRIFWTASGFGEDEGNHPEKVEHFGISTVEAMAAGAIPFAYNAGGYRETIDDGRDGILWKTIPELVRKTKFILEDPKNARAIARIAQEDANHYSEERFEREVREII